MEIYKNGLKGSINTLKDQVATLSEEKAAKTEVNALATEKANVSDLVNGLNFKGSCLYASLPTSGNTVGDYWYCTDSSHNWAWNGTSWYDLGEVNYTEVTELKETISSVGIKGYKLIQPSETDHTIRSQYVPTGAADNNFTTFYYPVNANEIYYIDTLPIGGSYTAATFLNSDKTFLNIGGTDIAKQVYKEKIVVPNSEYIKIMAISVLTENADKVGVNNIGITDYYKNGMVYGGINSERQIFLKKKRNDNEDLCIMIEPTLGNSLYGFSHIFKVENNESLNEDITNSETRNLLSIPTDIFSPYIVQATTNINGDLPSGYDGQFTGGSHQYNNSSTGSTPTAKTENVKVYADGIELNNEFRYANEIRIEFDNLIQGNNTMKADGSGRAIIKEHWTITFTEKNIECHNEIIALEPIKISRYYGLQTYSLSDLWYLIGGRKAPFTSGDDNGYSEHKKCNYVKCVSDNLTIECEIDANYGLGNCLYSETVNYSMTKMGLKTYYSAIYDDVELQTNGRLYIKGSYKLN